jgi:trimeric autotransporter adhesin
MGKIETDHTGSGGGITLSSDGTSLLLDGTAVGGSPDLYAENYDGTSTKPSATGTNAVAIGRDATATNTDAFAIGRLADATGSGSVAIGYNADATGNFSVSLGRNTVASAYYSIAMGYHGDATAAYAVAIGNSSAGHGPAAVGSGAMALGGAYASGASSFAVHQQNNSNSYGATGANSVAIGRLSKATAADSFAIGDNNVVSGNGAFALGNTNTASGGTAIAIGKNHTVSGLYATCIGGSTSRATQAYAMTFGPYAKAAVENAFIFGSKGWFSAGSAQGGMYILYADTTDATAEALTTTNSTAGSTNQIILPNNSAYSFSGTIVARQQASQGTACAAWKVEGLIRREANAGTTVLVNSATTVLDNTPSWGMALSADTTNGGLAITITGAASTYIRWVATINTSEVTY